MHQQPSDDLALPISGGDEAARQMEQLARLERATATLRHDLRGILAPVLLIADRLLAHPDPKVVKAGETVVKSIRRAEARLEETKGLT